MTHLAISTQSAMLPSIPGYDCLACLGGGPLTCVFAARKHGTGETVIVKTVRTEWTNASMAIKLLQREARAGLTLRHAHLVRIIEAHVTRPPHFLVMEAVAGKSLREWLQCRSRLDLQQAISFARQTAQALLVLHRRGFVHGDVKPENVLAADEDSAVLIDLGFAHRPGENTTFLANGYVLGTPCYLAPEAMTADTPRDFRSDLYSLGVMFFEMLTGKLPFPSASVGETLRRHREQRPADPRQYLPNLPTPMLRLLDQLLAKSPNDRPPNALALLHRLIPLEAAERRRLAG